MSIGYESGKCTLAVQGGILGVIRALLLVINICYPNHLSAPY
jgi:hypothetical protein